MGDSGGNLVEAISEGSSGGSESLRHERRRHVDLLSRVACHVRRSPRLELTGGSTRSGRCRRSSAGSSGRSAWSDGDRNEGLCSSGATAGDQNGGQRSSSLTAGVQRVDQREGVSLSERTPGDPHLRPLRVCEASDSIGIQIGGIGGIGAGTAAKISPSSVCGRCSARPWRTS